MYQMSWQNLTEADDRSFQVDGADELTQDASEDTEVGKSYTASDAPKFLRKPLTFLQEWLAIRRKQQDFAHTPMGI